MDVFPTNRWAYVHIVATLIIIGLTSVFVTQCYGCPDDTLKFHLEHNILPFTIIYVGLLYIIIIIVNLAYYKLKN